MTDLIGSGASPTVNDPWAAVSRDGQPVAFTDATPMTGFQQDCSSRDHCLRPWVWFVDAPRDPLPARWDGSRFVHADLPDAPIERPGVAYRTRAATASDLTPGTRVLVYDGTMPPNSEVEAHRLNWSFVEVGAVDRNRGTFTDRADQRHPVSQARVLVLYWFAGDKAATVEPAHNQQEPSH